jgi:hypothetical protein
MDFVERYSYNRSCPCCSNKPLNPKEQDKERAGPYIAYCILNEVSLLGDRISFAG